MRLFPRLWDQFIALSASPSSLTCCFLERTGQGVQVIGFETFEGLYTENSTTIFNHTKTAHFINTFKKKYSIKNPRAAFSITGTPVVETILTLPHAKPPVADFIAREPKLRNTYVAYRYLLPAQNNNFTFYVCGMPHYLVLQYHLLATISGLQLTLVTTDFEALMHVHSYINGTSKRQIDIAPYIQETPYFQSLMSVQNCAKLVRFAPGLSVDMHTYAPHIMKACGLLYAGNI